MFGFQRKLVPRANSEENGNAGPDGPVTTTPKPHPTKIK